MKLPNMRLLQYFIYLQVLRFVGDTGMGKAFESLVKPFENPYLSRG